MLVRIGYNSTVAEITREQAGRIASRNHLSTAAAKGDNYIELPPGTIVHIDDLRYGNKGRLSFIPQLEVLAAQCGAVIQYPNISDSQDAHFTIPFEHGGARTGAGRPALAETTIRFSVTLTQDQSDYLDALGPTRSEALRRLINIAMDDSHADLS